MLLRALPCPSCGCGCECAVIPEAEELTDITKVSGTWPEPGIPGYTGSSSAVLLHNTAMPADMQTLFAAFLVGCGNQDQLRAIILWTDSSNYWYAQVAPNISGSDGQLKLFQVSSGTHTQRGTSQTIVGWDGSDLLNIQFCLFNETVRAQVFLEGERPDPTNVSEVEYGFAYSLSGTKVGVGTGTVIGNGNFFRIEAHRHELEPDCECVHGCLEANVPPPDDCTGQTLCCYADTLPAAVFLTVLDEAFTHCPNEATEQVAGHEMSLVYDECVEDFDGQPLYRWHYRSLSDFSPQLCDFYRFASLSCHACRVSAVNFPCAHHGNGYAGGPASFAEGASLNFISDTSTIPGSNCKVAANWDAICVEIDIIDCDPFYAESLDGKFIISE